MRARLPTLRVGAGDRKAIPPAWLRRLGVPAVAGATCQPEQQHPPPPLASCLGGQGTLP
ncbi:hypothetical protein BRCON_2256 [Candidatus Sumerlaea chitinivorans]|uniref:Uncharacterized protein n=1 Tax=Sumerlaea chitinivorans TaxID=2250252 RepID=A0A2Z4Y9D5_SUMC1|nr:hypothetical protein BRCON_2256 [Candidatus Sumerlaea chitinivorans]